LHGGANLHAVMFLAEDRSVGDSWARSNKTHSPTTDGHFHGRRVFMLSGLLLDCA
jgi:hypothetical protein